MNKRLVVISVITLMVLILAGCGAAQTEQGAEGNSDSAEQGTEQAINEVSTSASIDITEDNIAEICDILRNAGLSNTDIFEEWVRERGGDSAEDDSETSGFSDADCRMTVMLLAGDSIEYDDVDEEYKGDYLMFDIDAIDNNENYSILKDKRALFTTMFGEMAIPESGFASALAEKWDAHDIRVKSEKFSIISILFKAYNQDEAFVGHTGLLVDCRDNHAVKSDYAFVEKIGFGEPFKITYVKDESELIDILSKRADYSVEDEDPTPAVYRNNEMIGELARQ
ncbi:MAG: DUF4300 family protein [Mogibacterium sp.]|nr:DUF4300 family protein [Mogibacterium sp.]